jgi:hypothetical protein
MRMRRETFSEVDAPAIEQLAARRECDKHGRVTVLDHADRRGSLGSSSRHVSLAVYHGDVTDRSRDRIERILIQD